MQNHEINTKEEKDTKEKDNNKGKDNKQKSQEHDEEKNPLLENIEKLHTTPMGIERIKRNLSLENEDVVVWCKQRIKSSEAIITRKGKNWYIEVDGCIITVNAYSYTIITAHKIKK